MIRLSILFQDEWLVAIDKPPGFLVHPSDQPKSDDLVAMKILRDQIEKNIRGRLFLRMFWDWGIGGLQVTGNWGVFQNPE